MLFNLLYIQVFGKLDIHVFQREVKNSFNGFA